MRVFVTVGTTKFDSLIHAILSTEFNKIEISHLNSVCGGLNNVMTLLLKNMKRMENLCTQV